jgi:hypothetical protein
MLLGRECVHIREDIHNPCYSGPNFGAKVEYCPATVTLLPSRFPNKTDDAAVRHSEDDRQFSEIFVTSNEDPSLRCRQLHDCIVSWVGLHISNPAYIVT